MWSAFHPFGGALCGIAEDVTVTSSRLLFIFFMYHHSAEFKIHILVKCWLQQLPKDSLCQVLSDMARNLYFLQIRGCRLPQWLLSSSPCSSLWNTSLVQASRYPDLKPPCHGHGHGHGLDVVCAHDHSLFLWGLGSSLLESLWTSI